MVRELWIAESDSGSHSKWQPPVGRTLAFSLPALDAAGLLHLRVHEFALSSPCERGVHGQHCWLSASQTRSLLGQ